MEDPVTRSNCRTGRSLEAVGGEAAVFGENATPAKDLPAMGGECGGDRWVGEVVEKGEVLGAGLLGGVIGCTRTVGVCTRREMRAPLGTVMTAMVCAVSMSITMVSPLAVQRQTRSTSEAPALGDGGGLLPTRQMLVTTPSHWPAENVRTRPVRSSVNVVIPPVSTAASTGPVRRQDSAATASASTGLEWTDIESAQRQLQPEPGRTEGIGGGRGGIGASPSVDAPAIVPAVT